MIAILKREIRSYFTTPIGYIFIAVFLCASGGLLAATTLFSMSSDTTQYFSYMLFLYVIMLPLLTMKSFSEERKQKTEQLVLTAPVTLWGMVTAKFLAAFALFLGCQVVASLAIWILAGYAELKVATIFGSLFAMILVGAAFISVGLFVSALTENQLAAAVGTVGILLVFLLISVGNGFIDSYVIRFILSCLSIWSRFQNFTQGVFDVAGLVYYLSVTGVFLFLTVGIYDKRRYH